MSDNIELVLSKIKEIESILSPEDYSENAHIEYYNKQVAILKILEQRVKAQKNVLYGTSVLNGIINNMNNLCSYVNSFHQSRNSSYINHINNTLNELLDFVSKIPVNQKGDTFATLEKIVRDFEDSNSNITNKLRKENSELNQQILVLTQNVAKLERKIEEKSIQLDNITTTQQQQFSIAQEKRLNDFSSKLEEFANQFETKKIEQDKLYNTNFQALKDSAEKRLGEMEQIQQKIEKIYGIVGKEAVVGSQKKYADNARDFANILFWGSIGLMLVFALVVVWPVLEALCNSIIVFDPTKTFSNLNWNILLCRLPIAALLLLPAIYMANESKKQRDKENKYRELEIKMAAVEPYFNNISESTKDEQTNIPEKDVVKLELAKALLSPGVHTSEKNVIIPHEISNLIENIVKIVCNRK